MNVRKSVPGANGADAAGGLGAKLASPRRLTALAERDGEAAKIAERLIEVAIRGLPRMLLAPGEYCFTRRGVVVDGVPTLRVEGRSDRYSAITMLGARHLEPERQREVLGGLTAREAADGLVRRLGAEHGLGDVALATWAAAATHAETLPEALALLGRRLAGTPAPYVVELAWAVSALAEVRGTAAADSAAEQRLAAARDLLLASRPTGGPLFPHAAPGVVAGWREHVGCFADQVYPIQALARLHRSGDDPAALAAAQAGADRITELQGPAGQWWWHYDARNGSVVEGFPVYSVHQHAMGPMALLDLQDAGGQIDPSALVDSLRWMVERPETAERFILDEQGVTWRKAARHDPRKLVRAAAALTTSVAPGVGLPGLDRVLRPTAIDRECRPYEFGWLLDTWLG